MHLMTSLLLLLIVARVFGELAERLGQPSMIGEIAAGIVLGPTLLGWVTMTPALSTISELGVLLLVLLAGMELDPSKIFEALRGRRSAVAILGFVIPLAAGLVVGAAFGLDALRIVFLGLCIAITALPVAVRLLIDVGELQTPVGRQIVAAAAANDVLALLILGIIIDTAGQPGWRAFGKAAAWSAVKVASLMLLFAGAYRAARRVTSWVAESQAIIRSAYRALKGKETLFAGTLLFILLFASISENAGLHFVVGAFFGAMLISRQLLGDANYEEVRRTASGMTMGLLAPIFFAGLGLEFSAAALKNYGLVAAIIAAAFAGKLGGGYLGGRLAGFSETESRMIGAGMNGRGIMELVIANIALKQGFIGEGLFAALVLMGVVTTLATPSLLKRAARRDAGAPLHAPRQASCQP